MGLSQDPVHDVYIVLYERDGPAPTYHWAIGIADNYMFDALHVLQIDDRSGDWEYYYPHTAPIHVWQDNRFHLAVHVGTVNSSPNVVFAFAQEGPAGMGDTPLLSTHGKWSCALWIIRLLHELQESETFSSKINLSTPHSQEKFYRTVLAIAGLASTEPDAMYPLKMFGLTRVVDYPVS